jgi:hypothetical protein
MNINSTKFTERGKHVPPSDYDSDSNEVTKKFQMNISVSEKEEIISKGINLF